MRRITTDIAIIGGGPAGLTAARAAAAAGAKVEVIDAGFLPGGQYWMQHSSGAPPASDQAVEGRAAIDAAKAAGVAFHEGAEVWAVFPDLRIGINALGGPFEIAPRAIIVASGAHDRVMPFPGWTLPGVMTPGASQRLAKLGGISAGDRVVLAGSGPFLLAVAQTLAKLDKPPIALIDARKPGAGMLAHLARHPRRWSEAAKLLAATRKIADRRSGWIVTEAIGTERVTAVRIAPIAADGAIAHDRAEVIAGIDALLIGWGFQPMIEVTALLRCRHDYDRDLGGWFCVADPATGRTSVDKVYAAGEVTGIAGALPARLSGRLAGLAAAADLGFSPPDLTDERTDLLPRLKSARHFAAGLARLYAPPKQLADLAHDDTIVCRCEEVTKRDITAALAAGTAKTLGAKMWSRAGMGRCQGRICGWAVAEIAARASGTTPEAAGFNAPRLPLRPVPLSVVLEATREPTL